MRCGYERGNQQVTSLRGHEQYKQEDEYERDYVDHPKYERFIVYERRTWNICLIYVSILFFFFACQKSYTAILIVFFNLQ